MQNLGLEEGDMVNLKSAMLPKGSYVKLRPRKSEFLKITNPRAVYVLGYFLYLVSALISELKAWSHVCEIFRV